MSGGSYDYLSFKIEDACDTLDDSKSPLRRAFAQQLRMYADAMRAIEWVDSGDWADGDEIAAIEAAMGSNAKSAALKELLEEARSIKNELEKYCP